MSISLQFCKDTGWTEVAMFSFKPTRKCVSRTTAWLRITVLILAAVALPQVGLLPLSEGTGGELDELPLEIQCLVRTERLAPMEAQHTRREPFLAPPSSSRMPEFRIVAVMAGHVLPSGQRAPLTC